MSKALITITDLGVSYRTDDDSPAAVRHENLVLREHETLAIVGESGSGKTTIANAILGLLPDDARVTGSISLGNVELTALRRGEWPTIRGRRIGYVPQDPMLSLNEVWSIGHHFKETIDAHKLGDGKPWREFATERLLEVGLSDPERILRQFPHQLSGGMRQRVLIALAVLARPEVIIADEPTSALDVIIQKHVLDLLERLTRQLGASLVLITHDLGLVADRSDSVVVMRHGEIVETGPTRNIIGNPQHPYTQELLHAVPKLSSIESRVLPDLSDAPAVLEIKGLVKEFKLKYPRAATPGTKPSRILRAVNGVDLTLRSGECLALVGESGSGKSTVAKIILGLEKPTSGSVLLHGRDRESGTRAERVAQTARIQVVFQDPYASLDPQFTVSRTLNEPLVIHVRGDASERRDRVVKLLGLVGLDESILNRYPSELSGGQRQRVAIARALALEPDVLVLDEAVSALDVVVQGQILETLRELRSRIGLSMLFITHDLAVVAEIADTIAVITNGEIVESGDAASVFASPEHEYTKELLDAVPGRSAF
ncbi:MAG: ABC transporter ATP-binding protein [Propionibacteriaceae bacterium]|jgi:peptide/nickel transport system ATP-binding protein|nr:ABC transporter ATP-binding protein [Propionibacteriaceae bacterium]